MMPDKPENRVDRIVSDLLRGRRLKLRGGDAEEKEAITMAARLAAASQGPQRMSSTFRSRLAAALESPPHEGWCTPSARWVASSIQSQAGGWTSAPSATSSPARANGSRLERSAPSFSGKATP